MPPATQFWYEKLQTGRLLENHNRWESQVERAALHQEYIEFAGKAGLSRRGPQTELGMALNKLVPGLRCVERTIQNKRTGMWEFPSLEICRRAFAERTRSSIPWPAASADPPIHKGGI